MPIGVIAIIYESRAQRDGGRGGAVPEIGHRGRAPGGSDAIESNRALCGVLERAAREAGLPEGCVSLVQDTSREAVNELMRRTASSTC